MAKIKIDKKKCLGCGACVSLCPACFKIGEDGKAEAVKEQCESQDCDLKEVINSCPTQAISYEQ